MRLIDADELKQELEKNKTFESDEYTEGVNTGISWCNEDVDNASTVEAIPVAWIEKRIDSYIQFYEKKEKTEPAIARSISNAIDAISELLDDWREENETN